MGSRAYLVGLPVVVTVHEDGWVQFSVDVSEAYTDLEANTDDAGLPEYSEETVEADAILIRLAVENTRHGYLDTATLPPPPQGAPDA